MTNRIDAGGYPLAFKVKQGALSKEFKHKLHGEEVIQVEARQMFAHQKEAITTEGKIGDVWRLPSDEGLHLHGTDLAPFPLGFFNAGIQGDLFHLIHQLALNENIAIDAINIELSNHYWLTGSFILGTGEGHAEPTNIRIQVQSSSPKPVLTQLINQAIQLSPAIQFLRGQLKNSFALYINGRRRPTPGLIECSGDDAVDPFLSHSKAPTPLSSQSIGDLLIKLPTKEDGEIKLAPKTIEGKMLRNVLGKGSWKKGDHFAEMDTWLEMPGTTHFAYKTDVGGYGEAPSGLSLMSSGIAFCFMTQLARYVEGMKMDIHGIRLVQINPYQMNGEIGKASPIQTHLFLNGNAPEETHTKLLEIAERTCYLHASASTPLEPEITILIE
jgi:hypothetical protein